MPTLLLRDIGRDAASSGVLDARATSGAPSPHREGAAAASTSSTPPLESVRAPQTLNTVQSGDPGETATIEDLLMSGQSASDVARSRPPSTVCADGSTSCPLPVTISVTITDVFDIDQSKSTFEVQGQVVLQWHDSRLAMPTGTTRVQLHENDVWTPQIDFYNNVATLLRPATRIALLGPTPGPTGLALLTQTMRFVGTFAMRMNFAFCARTANLIARE